MGCSIIWEGKHWSSGYNKLKIEFTPESKDVLDFLRKIVGFGTT